MTIDIKRLEADLDYWNEVAPDGATHYGPECETWLEAWFKSVEDGRAQCLLHGKPDKWSGVTLTGEPLIPRPSTAWNGEGLTLESTSDFRKALAMNLQQSIKAITGYVFPDDESLILAHELMDKYDLSEKL